MIVHKFGGGILKSPEAVQRLVTILSKLDRPTVVVVSALNKMTNALERLVAAWYDQGETTDIVGEIREFHWKMASVLLDDHRISWERHLAPLFTELEATLAERPTSIYDQAYDRIIVFGELLSTALIRTVLEEELVRHVYLDARDVVVTDETWRDGQVHWDETRHRVGSLGLRDRNGDQMILTQGFIGRSSEGDSVSLGREGSDYTAAIFGHCLAADEVWIWKDVPGVMNADPAEFEDTRRLQDMSYLEAIEMAFFGAKVLHPKTIKPLQNKQIPLWVKDFSRDGDEGTLIRQLDRMTDQTPVFISKKNQVLITFQPRDFSFIVEEMVSEIFLALHRFRIRVNLMQHGAVSFTICVNDDPDRINTMISHLLPRFRILYNTGLELLTIRRYNQELIRKMTQGRRILIQQLSRKTARFVLISG